MCYIILLLIIKKNRFSNFITNKATGCCSFEELNLSNFQTNNVINMSSMFSGCSSLRVLDISNFNINNNINISNIFFECSAFISLHCKNDLINKEYQNLRFKEIINKFSNNLLI